jgi:hypothetical protein
MYLASRFLEALQIYLFISVFSIRASSTNINRIATLRHWRLNLFFSTLTNWRTCTPIQISSIYYKKKDGTKVVMFHNTTCPVRRFKRCCCQQRRKACWKVLRSQLHCMLNWPLTATDCNTHPHYRISDSFFLIQQLKVEKDIYIVSPETWRSRCMHAAS